jgi:hypothetical protein
MNFVLLVVLGIFVVIPMVLSVMYVKIGMTSIFYLIILHFDGLFSPDPADLNGFTNDTCPGPCMVNKKASFLFFVYYFSFV